MAHTKVTKTHSQNTGVANTFSYSGSFDVFKGTEVQAELDNVALTYTASTINESASPREYTVDTSASTIHIGGADLSSGTIVIRPVTDMGAPTPRATYAPGSSITSEDLNNNQTQLMRKAMEYDEQKLSSLGGTMTGHLTMGEDQTIIFEGATDDGYETTLTVTDPTADRTITLPNVTGTVVTTGDTASVTATMLAADSVDSSELVDGSIDSSHISSSAITTGKIAADAVTGAKIADDAINSEHYTDGSIDTAHIGDSQVTTAKIADTAITTAKITDANVTTAKLASDAVTTAKITDLNVTTAKIAADAITGAKIADDAIDSEHYTDGSIDTAHIADLNVTTAKIAADAITGAKIADDAIDSEHYTDASIDTAHITDANITAAKLASNSVETSKITDANVTTAKIADDAITIAKIGCEQTTISDSDSYVPTSGAVVDYVSTQLSAIGGFETITTDAAFPNTQPPSGVIVSIADAGGLVVDGSGSSTTGRTVGGSTVTIANINSQFNSTTVAAGVAMLVESTGSGHSYSYHKATLKEADLINLSTDINDFGNRYRVNAGEPGSNNDEGDLVYDTNADKMKVYDSTTSAWKEVTSSGDFKYLFLCPAGGSGSPTLDGSIATYDLRESSNSGAAASVTSAAQLIVSINGVIQKANTGTSAPAEGFALVDSNTIIFGANLASGDSVFIIQIGSAITISTPGDGTVVEAKIGSGAVTTAKIADSNVTTAKIAGDAITGAKIADDAIDSEHYTDGSVDHVHLAADCVDGDNIQDDVINSEHIAAGAVDLEHMSSESVDEDNLHISNAGSNGQYLSKQSGNSGGLTWADVSSGAGKNIIINGAQMVDQRNSGSSLTMTSSGQFITDRFKCWEDTDGGLTAQQVSDGPTGFKRSLKFTVTSADSSIGASQYAMLRYPVEGYDMEDQNWGDSSAGTLTLSFWVKCSITGTFGGGFVNSSDDRSYPFTYAISSADTWEKKTVTVAGDQTGTWNAGTSACVNIHWSLGIGSNNQGTAGQWQAGNKYTASGETALIGTNSATWQITGVQFERGSSATDFEYRSYGDELARCQRYYWQESQNHYATAYTSAHRIIEIAHPVPMRAVPTETVTVGGGTFTHFSETNMSFRAWVGSAYNDGDPDYFTLVKFNAEL